MITPQLIIDSIPAEGIDVVELAGQLGVPTIEVDGLLKKLASEGQVKSLNGEVYYSSASEDLAQLKKEIITKTAEAQWAFFEIGIRLKLINDRELYKLDGYPTFVHFAEGEFGFKRGHAYRLINAAQAYEDIKPVASDTSVIKERHMRELCTKEPLEPEERQAIWEEVEAVCTDEENNLELNHRKIKEVVEGYLETRRGVRPGPELKEGDYCRVKLRAGNTSEVKPWNGKVVKICAIAGNTAYCRDPFGPELEEPLTLRELIPCAPKDTEHYRLSLTIEEIEALASLHIGSIHQTLLSLIGDKNG